MSNSAIVLTSKHVCSIGGIIGLLFWSLSGLLVSNIIAIPVFESLSFTLGIGFTISCIVLTKRKKWQHIRQPIVLWVVGILGIYGNDVCFFAASKYAPVAQVIIINFLWPIFVLVFSQILLNEKFKVKHILSICLGLGAICLALMEKFGYIHFEYTKGYILAFGSATSWTIFMLFSRSYRHVTSEFVGMCLGVGCILSIIFHLNFERFVLPNFRELFSICLIGLFIKGSAYYLWDMGIKRGNFQLLIVLAYVQPILSIIWLMLFGYTKISLSIFMASFLIFTACFILTKK